MSYGWSLPASPTGKEALRSAQSIGGKLVMELVYEYLDEDVAEWLKNNAPSPQGNLSYHRWLTSQYGLRKLVEHIWMLVGMARGCQTMRELRDRMAMQFGRSRSC